MKPYPPPEPNSLWGLFWALVLLLVGAGLGLLAVLR